MTMCMIYRTKDIIKQVKTSATCYDITPTYNPHNKSEVWVFVNQQKVDAITSHRYIGTVAQFYFDTIEAAERWISIGDYEPNVNWWAS